MSADAAMAPDPATETNRDAAGVAVSVRGVSKAYPAGRDDGPGGVRPALSGVSLEVPVGERLALLGPNGSGKSTLLRMLSTALAPDSGTVEVLGHRLYAAAAEERRVRARLGVVFQHPGLDALLTVEENLRTHAALYGMSGARTAERIEWAAGQLGIAERLRDRVGTLSGGLARRADLARALLHDPDLLLLDEPSTGLDLRARREFMATVEAVAAAPRAGGPVTVVLSTHLMDEAEGCRRVALLRRGELVAVGTPEELRRGLGAAVVRIQPSASHGHDLPTLLRRHVGLAPIEVVTGASGAPVLRSAGDDPAALLAVLPGLGAAGIAFEFAPPTLADVYLAATGEGLDADAATAAAAPARGRRRRGGAGARA